MTKTQIKRAMERINEVKWEQVIVNGGSLGPGAQMEGTPTGKKIPRNMEAYDLAKVLAKALRELADCRKCGGHGEGDMCPHEEFLKTIGD